MSDRVDKQWQKKGLEGYSTSAILGTLQHYGIAVDEAGFRAAAADRFPAQLAMEWIPRWKGTGQFAGFPYPAATELSRRLFPDRLMPADLARGLAELLGALLEKRSGAAVDPTPAFDNAEGLLQKLPASDEARRGFLDETMLQLGEKVVRAVDELAEALARAGHLAEGKRFAELEEKLLPERRGIATALVQAVAGDREGAVEKLRSAADEPGRPLETKVMAVESLVHLQALDEALQVGKPALDTAEAMGEHHAAMALCDRLGWVLEKLGRREELALHAERARRISAAHKHAHPHHH
jgi:hypothetical protein